MRKRKRFRHAVNIEHAVKAQDPNTGAETETWEVLHGGVWCDIEPLSVKDYLQSKATQSEISVRVVIRHIAGLDASMRLVGACGCHAGKIYNPSGLLEDMDSGIEYITMPCSQGVNDG